MGFIMNRHNIYLFARAKLSRHLLMSTGSIWLALLVPSASAKDDVAGEIIITATRRAENFQEVPLSLTVFTASQLEQYRPVVLEDISRHVPNLWMPPSTEAGQSFMTIRGVSAGITRSAGRSVGVYVDGVYLSADSAINMAMLDIERIEILKGPQGTLFGRDTLGGTINIITRKPSLIPRSSLKIDVGNYGLTEFTGRASLPLVANTLYLGLTVNKRDTAGYIHNAFTGRKAGAENHFNFKSQLFYTPNGKFDARLVFNTGRVRDRPNTQGEAVTNPGSDTIPYTINLDQDEFQNQDRQSLSFSANYTLDNGSTINWISGRAHVDDFYIQDGDRLPDAITVAQFDGGAEEFSQEIRYVSRPNNRFDYLAGAYFLEEKRQFNPTFPLMGTTFLERVLGIPPVFHPANTLDGQNVTTRSKSLAAYAHGNFYLTSRFSVFGGLRYTTERKTVDYNSFGEVFEVFGLPPLSAISTIKSHPLSWMTGARYRFTDQINGYASISRGYRSPAIKDDFVSAADLAAGSGFFTRPEFLTNYETGIKTAFFNHKLRANLSIFYMDYTDIQASVSRPPFLFLRSLTNAAKAHITGFEADVSARISPALKLSASTGYVRSRYDRFIPSPGTDLSGTSFGNAPVWTISSAIDYAQPLPGGQTLNAHLDYTNRTAPHKLAPGEPAFVGDYGIFNGAISYGEPNTKWKIALWVKNIGNVQLPMATKLWGAGLGPLIENQTVRYEPPRRFGISLTYQWADQAG